MSDDDREWLKVGAEVATLRNNWRSDDLRPHFAKVDRIGKRDVVLDNGERFNIKRLRRDEGGTWGWSVALLPADSDVVREALNRHERAMVVYRAKKVCDDFRYGKSDVSAGDVILACAPLTGVEDEIRRLFTPAADAGGSDDGEVGR